jgi:hypothetical protein
MDLRHDLSFFKLIADSYCRLTGQSIIPSGMTIEDPAKWLYEDAPFAILAHNTAPDPVFVYGNRASQRLFEYNWDDSPNCRRAFLPKHRNVANANGSWNVLRQTVSLQAIAVSVLRNPASPSGLRMQPSGN